MERCGRPRRKDNRRRRGYVGKVRRKTEMKKDGAKGEEPNKEEDCALFVH